MSTTPGSKLSPYGNKINKTLLTPCRRLGLSRKMKTPNSIEKLSDDLNLSIASNKLQGESPGITPVNKKTSIKRERLCPASSSLEKKSKLEGKPKSQSTAKKSLNKCFSNKKTEGTDTTDVKDIDVAENILQKCKIEIENQNDKAELFINNNEQIVKKTFEVISKEVATNKNHVKNKNKIETIAQIHANSIQSSCDNDSLLDHDYPKVGINIKGGVIKKNITNCLSEESISNVSLNTKSPIKKNITNCLSEESISNVSLNSLSPISRKPCKYRILSDSDDDFTTLPVQKPNFKKSKSSNERILLQRNSSIKSEVLNQLQNFKVTVSRLTEDVENIENNSEKEVNMSLDDEENIKCVKKKKSIVLSDEDDDLSPLNSLSNNDALEIKLKNKNSPKSNIKAFSIQENKKTTEKKSKSSKTFLKSKLSFLSETEDDDAFTSTPDREKNEKRELIDKIKGLESIIRLKKQKLDALNRASIYKSKHNIDELVKITQSWRQGCISGLSELLQKIQDQGPIDMATLLRNLHIPDDMVARIFVNVF